MASHGRIARFAAPTALAAFALLAAATLACGASDVATPDSAGGGAVASPVVPSAENILPSGTHYSVVADVAKIRSSENLDDYAASLFSSELGCPLWISERYYNGSEERDAYCETSEGGELDKIRFIWDNHPYALGTSLDNANIVHHFRIDIRHYYAASGDFDFAGIRERLRDSGYASEAYAGAEIWTGKMPEAAIERSMQAALYEDAKMFIVAGVGSNRDKMRELIDAVALGGDLAAQSQDLRRVREKAGVGIMAVGMTYPDGFCDLLDGESGGERLTCLANAVSITADGKYKTSMLLPSEKDAELLVDLLSEPETEVFADIKADGDLVSWIQPNVFQ